MATPNKPSTPAKGNLQVTPEEGRIEPVLGPDGLAKPAAKPAAKKTAEPKVSEPANIELETPSEEPVPAPAAVSKEEIETDVRTKLNKRSDEENIFVPSNPVALEKAATVVAENDGFELNRGTSIGARLMAKARKFV
jgi:hypothetical protein